MPSARATPHPDAEPLHRAALHLLRLLRREDDASGLTPARLSALSVLVFGGPRSLGALARAEGVSAATMSRLITGLEADGWVARDADPADARVQRLVASPAARRALRAGRDRRLAALSRGLEALDPADRDALHAALAPLDRLVGYVAVRNPMSPSSRTASPNRAKRSSRAMPFR